jgi:putative nucleotidyltransferase with HDIG domain
MDTVESAGLSTEAKSTGILGGMRGLVGKLFSPKSTAPAAPTRPAAKSKSGTEDKFVIAPGGYRIRVPDESDIERNAGEMVPEIRAGLSQLPPLPNVVADLLREIQNENSTASSIAQIVAIDPALCASILRTVNSAAMGLTRKITAVNEAISFLGVNTVKSVVMRLRLGELLAPVSQQTAMDTEDLWIHCLATSYAAECLSKKSNGVDGGFVATLGLLHDIGRLIVVSRLPDLARALGEAATAGSAENILTVERRVLGIDHAHLGGDLAAAWKLPPDLVQGIHWHHHPAGAFQASDPLPLRKSVHLVQIADQLTKYCYPYADHVQIDSMSKETYETVGLEPSFGGLLDERMRKAISRAIFIGESNSQRPPAMQRRFLRPIQGETARIVAAADRESATLVEIDDPAIEELFAEGRPLIQLNPKANAMQIDKTILNAKAQIACLKLSTDSRAAALMTVGSLLANLQPLCQVGETIDLSIQDQDNRAIFAIRTPGLSASRRVTSETTPETARRLAAADLANVLNLDWFERIAVSSTGDALLFETH